MHGKIADAIVRQIWGQMGTLLAALRMLLSCAGAPAHVPPRKPALRPMPSGPPEQSQVQRVIQRMQKKDPYRIFAEVPSEEMVSALLQVTALSPQVFGKDTAGHWHTALPMPGFYRALALRKRGS